MFYFLYLEVTVQLYNIHRKYIVYLYKIAMDRYNCTMYNWINLIENLENRISTRKQPLADYI